MVEEAKPTHKLNTKEEAEAWLTENGISFETVEHDPVMTIADMMEKVKFTGVFEKTMFAKNLFFQDKKKKERLWLVICAHDTKFDTKDLQKEFKVGSGNLRGGSLETMEATLGAKKGAVTLFSIANDEPKAVNLVIDKRLTEEFDYIGFHPMVNTATTAITKADMMKVIEACGREAQILDFSKFGSADADAKPAPAKPAKQPKQEGGKKGGKKQKPAEEEKKHEEAIQYSREKNFSLWYQQVITKAQLIEYYDVSGCYILRPSSFFIWEQIQGYFDAGIKKLGVQNCYFPMFVTAEALNKEQSHVDGFTAEVAWVTKSGQSELEKPIAIRPTSETIMYPAYAKWIRSHRDLPLLLNQWTSVVRWEFKHPTPFIRTREFLWQEGHTAHATKEEAVEFMLKIQDLYAKTYEELLAVPVIRGRKSENERFPGADDTSTVELYVPANGRGIQGATSHHLGQNFSKMFEVSYEDANLKRQNVWQTSWGISTRSIGALIMIHSDDTGLVLPPKVAQTQFVIIPIKYKQDDPKVLYDKAHELAKQMRDAGLRVTVDDTDTHNPGFKFSQWEVKGVPVRLELGMKDFEKGEVRVAVRHSGTKFQAKWDNIAHEMTVLLQTIHKEMYEKAEKARESHCSTVTNWEQFMESLNNRNICLADWCDEKECEEKIGDQSKEESEAMAETAEDGKVILTGAAKTLCIPYQIGKQASGDPKAFEGAKCFYCGADAKVTALWGRSY